MNSDFYENLGSAYKALEEKLQIDREGAMLFLDAHPDTRKKFEPLLDLIFFVSPPKGHSINSREHLAGRIPVNLGNGYLGKFFPEGELSNLFFYNLVGNSLDNRFEEQNMGVLRDHGFTEENGFFVPEHKIVGISIQDRIPKVDQNGHGWAIVEDVSQGGVYEVIDIMPHHFVMLDNRVEFYEAYKRNIWKLFELYNDPTINPSVYRHGTPKNPVETLSKMLLAKVKDNKGEIIVGDLNNVRFDKN